MSIGSSFKSLVRPLCEIAVVNTGPRALSRRLLGGTALRRWDEKCVVMPFGDPP
jgi:hypothetical protein